MNRFAQKQYEQIKELLTGLNHDFQEYEKRLAGAKADKEQKIKEYWAATNEANAFRETVKGMPALEEENCLLRKKNQEALARAQRILDYAKALSGVIQP